MSEQFTRINDPLDNAPLDRLHLVDFKSERSRMQPYKITGLFNYQWGDKVVLLILLGQEPTYSLNRLMTIAHEMTAVKIGIRYPVTWYIRKALYKQVPGQFSHGAYVYGKALHTWQQK